MSRLLHKRLNLFTHSSDTSRLLMLNLACSSSINPDNKPPSIGTRECLSPSLRRGDLSPYLYDLFAEISGPSLPDPAHITWLGSINKIREVLRNVKASSWLIETMTAVAVKVIKIAESKAIPA